MQTIGEIIKKKRKDRNWSQQKLAEKLGVTDTSIAHWEKNINSPNLLIACDLADIFKCSLDELCGRK